MPKSTNAPTRAPVSAHDFAACAAASLILWSAAGCQRYAAKPLDLAAHHEAFLARTPESPQVADFARMLTEKAGAAETGEPPFDLADGVSLAEAEAVALVFNADLRAARLRLGLTKAGMDNAGLWQDPSLGVDITRIIQSVAEPWKLAASVGITIPLSGRLGVEQDLAGSEHAVELARVVEAEWRTRIDLRRAWSEWSALRTQADAMRVFLEQVDQVLTIVDVMERAGEIARTEARLFRVEKAAKRVDVELLQWQLADIELRIKSLMGLSPGAAVSLVPGGFNRRAEGVYPVEMLLKTSPALAVAKAEYAAAEQSLRLEVRKQYPDLTLGPGYGREDGNDQFLLGIALPLPILNANRRGIAETHAAREVAKARAESVLEQLVSELSRAEARLNAARSRRRALETEVVPLVDAQYAEAREIARLGEVNTLVLLESLARQQEAKVRLIEAARDEALGAIRLDELIGPPPLNPPRSPSSSEFPVKATPNTGSPHEAKPHLGT